MNRALRQLLLLRLRGGFRHRVRQLASPGGALSFAVLVAVIWLLMTTDWYAVGKGGGSHADLMSLRANFADFMPFALLGATLLTVLISAGSPLHFSTSEINLLLAGPFSRRSVLSYKITLYLFGASVNAAIIAMLAPPRGTMALATFFGTASTLLFIQMASTTLILGMRAIRGSIGGRWSAIILVLVLVSAGVMMVGAALTPENSLSGTLRHIRHHWLGEALLAPFTVFVRIFLARQLWPDLLWWLSVSVGMNAALVYAVFLLDRYSGEPSPSRRSLFAPRPAAAGQGIRRGTLGRWSRRAPVLYGLGPIIWRQMFNALRGCDRVILVWLTIAAITGPLMALTVSADTLWLQLAVVFFAATYILPKTLLLDFRADNATIELYKALPLKAWQVAAGQVVVVALVASLIELTLMLGFWVTAGWGPAWWFGIAIPSIVLFNMMFFALEGLVFLLFPSPPVPVGRVDFEFMGRTLAEYFAKVAIVIAAVAVSGALGMRVLAATNGGIAPALLTAWLLLLGFGLTLIGLGGLAFRRFNVTEPMT